MVVWFADGESLHVPDGTHRIQRLLREPKPNLECIRMPVAGRTSYTFEQLADFHDEWYERLLPDLHPARIVVYRVVRTTDGRFIAVID